VKLFLSLKLITMAGSLLDREAVKSEMVDRYPSVIAMYSNDLDDVKVRNEPTK